MSIDRDLWKRPILSTSCPPWRCPSCDHGTLRLDPKSVSIVEDADSKRDRQHDAWEPEWLRERLTCTLICTDASCANSVAVVAVSKVLENTLDDLPEPNWHTVYDPRAMLPAPPLFPIPTDCPEDVSNAIREAFALYWGHPSASANAFRASVELMLDHKGVPRTHFVVKNGKPRRRRIDLHNRITMIKGAPPQLVKLLVAAKWIGNSGSHADELTRDDVLDGLELIEYAVAALFGVSERELVKMASAINRRRKPRSHH